MQLKLYSTKELCWTKVAPTKKKQNKKDIFFSLHNPHRIKLIQVTRLKSKDKIAKI